MPHGGSAIKTVTFSSRIFRERQSRWRQDPFVCIHRGHEEEHFLHIISVPFTPISYHYPHIYEVGLGKFQTTMAFQQSPGMLEPKISNKKGIFNFS